MFDANTGMRVVKSFYIKSSNGGHRAEQFASIRKSYVFRDILTVKPCIVRFRINKYPVLRSVIFEWRRIY